MSDQLEVRTVPVNPGAGAFLRRTWHLLLAGVVFIACFYWWWAFYAFTDEGYAPEQPIHYSHRLHAGIYGLDCTYCHFNAERGKHAGIPPISVCAGCHHPDQGAAGNDKPEVQRLLALIARAENELDPSYRAGETLVADSGDADLLKVGGQIHWDRIHKLPDHVYFRHEWHVKAGIACQTCHGPVQEMEVVQQFAPLTMGWCIDCHRQSHYVGGPDYDGSDQTFTVGTANYDVLRARIDPDRVVPFAERITKATDAHGHGADAHGADGHTRDAHVPVPAHTDQVEHQGAHRELRGSLSLMEELDDHEYNRLYFSAAQAATLAEVAASNDRISELTCADAAAALPRWRIADLPSVHARFYADPKIQAELGALEESSPEDRALWYKNNIRRFDSFQNAPTQCSTCHQ